MIAMKILPLDNCPLYGMYMCFVLYITFPSYSLPSLFRSSTSSATRLFWSFSTHLSFTTTLNRAICAVLKIIESCLDVIFQAFL